MLTGNARVHDTATCPSLRHTFNKGQIKTRANSQIPVAFFPYLWYSILVMETEEITKRIISTKYDDLYSILT